MKLALAWQTLIGRKPESSAMRTTSRAVERLIHPKRVQADLDPWLIWSAAILLLIGWVMVYSSSIAYAEGAKHTSGWAMYYMIRHGAYLILGIIIAAFLFGVPTQNLQKLSSWLFIAGIVLLIVVLIPFLGVKVNGATRWISLGIVRVQPSEFMKLFAVLYAADYTVRKSVDMGSFMRGFLPMAGVIVFVGMLIIIEPDFGALVVITIITFGILFFGGVNIRIFGSLAVVAVVSLMLLIWVSDYRRQRILGFMDPWKDELDTGYQLSHALIAFGRGEFFGVGLGASVEKLFYLPEAHTDFLLAVIAEELGFAGVSVIITLFAILVFRCFAVARSASTLGRHYAALVALGIGLWIGFQALISMGVNMGVLPTKGLTLPLMSYGGSGIVANCMALAVLLRVDWENRQLMQTRS